MKKLQINENEILILSACDKAADISTSKLQDCPFLEVADSGTCQYCSHLYITEPRTNHNFWHYLTPFSNDFVPGCKLEDYNLDDRED